MFLKIAVRYRYSAILLRQLVITDFKLRYQGSFLGYFWLVLRPLLLFLVLYVVFVKFLKIKANVSDPAVYLLLGIVIWSFFAEVTTRTASSIAERGDLLRKLSFSKYIIIFSVVMSSLINLVLSMAVVFIFMFFGTSHPVPTALVMVPLLIIELTIFAMGIGFLLSTLYVKLRDINYIREVIFQALYFTFVNSAKFGLLLPRKLK